MTDSGVINSVNYSPYEVVDSVSVPSDIVTKDTDVTTYPARSGKLNTYFHKNVADKHLKTLASEDPRDFGTYLKNNGYANGAYDVLDITPEQFDDICTYFNSRLGTFAPSGYSSQGALTNSSYAQLLYTSFYNACLYKPTTKVGESLHSGYAKGNWYVPSIEEMRILIAHRIISTTNASNASQSAQDWDSTDYNGRGIFTESNKAYFSGFLGSLGATNQYSYMTSDISGATQGFQIIYGETYDYNNSTKQNWLGSWPYYNAVQGGAYGSTVHQNCRRDKTYTMPLCCEITVSK